MSQTEFKCPKCNGVMIQGFVMDRIPGGAIGSHWIEGPAQKSFWSGVKLPAEVDWMHIGTFRCQTCGFLESYAREEFAPK